MGRDFQIEDPRCWTPIHRASFGQRPAKLAHHWIIHGASAERACLRQLAQSDEGGIGDRALRDVLPPEQPHREIGGPYDPSRKGQP